MTAQAPLASALVTRRTAPGRILLTLVALVAMLLCGFAVHSAAGHAHASEPPVSAPQHVGGQVGGAHPHADPVADPRADPHADKVADPRSADDPLPVAAAHPDAVALTCLMVLLTTAVLLGARPALRAQVRPRDAVRWRIDPSWAEPEPRTPTPRELSISRT